MVPETLKNTKRPPSWFFSGREKIFDIFFWYSSLWFTKNFAPDKYAAPETLETSRSTEKAPLLFRCCETENLRQFLMTPPLANWSFHDFSVVSACFSFRLYFSKGKESLQLCSFFFFQEMRITRRHRVADLLASCIKIICGDSAHTWPQPKTHQFFYKLVLCFLKLLKHFRFLLFHTSFLNDLVLFSFLGRTRLKKHTFNQYSRYSKSFSSETTERTSSMKAITNNFAPVEGPSLSKYLGSKASVWDDLLCRKVLDSYFSKSKFKPNCLQKLHDDFRQSMSCSTIFTL